MVEEKIYVFDDGTEMIVLERIKIDNINYMLLKNNKNNETKIGFENKEKVYFIDETHEKYDTIKTVLTNMLKENLEKI